MCRWLPYKNVLQQVWPQHIAVWYTSCEFMICEPKTQTNGNDQGINSRISTYTVQCSQIINSEVKMFEIALPLDVYKVSVQRLDCKG